MIAKVVIDKLTYNLDDEYDYIIPDELKGKNLAGCRVIVPFGIANQMRVGFCVSICETSTKKHLKKVYSIIDESPLLSEEMLKIVSFLKERTFCTFFEAIRCVLPTGLNAKILEHVKIGNNIEILSSEERFAIDTLKSMGENVTLSKFCEKLGVDKNGSFIKDLFFKNILVKYYFAEKISKDLTFLTAFLNENEVPNKLSAKQKSVYDYLKEVKKCRLKDIEDELDVSLTTIKSLEKKGLITIKKQSYLRKSINYKDLKPKKIKLNKEQEIAFNGLVEQFNTKKPSCALLYGVTGSGKTSVFLQLVDKVIKSGKTAIVMVPEISLTSQTLKQFYSRYKDEVAVFHSGLSLGQRVDEYKRVEEGKIKVVVGTRSAIFAPLKNLGVIIIDEEQEHTYKSDSNPRYHARDIAKFRCKNNNALLLLASATPSFESFSLAKKGVYSFYELKERYGEATLPEVISVDERLEVKKGNNGILSEFLIDEIRQTLENKNQTILLLNRRGHNTYISCPVCGHVFTCANCSISLTFHSANSKLKCHYCGSQHEVPSKCPKCDNERLRFTGAGTQKAFDEVQAIFPNARILRLDADSTTKKDSTEIALDAFGKHKYDILIGTQMVAKGLNFPKVTLVGVLSADNAMFFEDFKAYERAFSMLTQVVGRSGRGEKAGKAVIQTSNPDNYVIQYAKKQDFLSFYEKEIKVRKLMTYPPYCDIVVLGFVSDKKEISHLGAINTLKIIKREIEKYNDVKLIVLGPSPASVPVVNNKYRYRIILKTKNNKRFREFLTKVFKEYDNSKQKCSFFVDINPETII